MGMVGYFIIEISIFRDYILMNTAPQLVNLNLLYNPYPLIYLRTRMKRQQGIRLGFRTGRKFLISYLHDLKEIGVNHVAFNLKDGKRPAEEVVQELGEEVVPFFPALKNKN